MLIYQTYILFSEISFHGFGPFFFYWILFCFVLFFTGVLRIFYIFYALVLLPNSNWGSTASCTIGKLWRQRKKGKVVVFFKAAYFGRMAGFSLGAHFL